MSSPFETDLFEPLHQSNAYRLTGLVEMARLSEAERDKLVTYFKARGWPLLQQPQFANLQALGPWLFSSRPSSVVSGQGDFFHTLKQLAGDAVCGWLVSALPPAALATHLSQANIIAGPNGSHYMLRYYTGSALPALHARCDLPGIPEWLAPIHSWWVPVPHPRHEIWKRFAGYDRPDYQRRVPIVLDPACWAALAGDPLGYRLADQLKAPLAAAGRQANCHGTRLGLAQQYLAEARQLGLTNQDDLCDYVKLMALNGDALRDTPAWQQALRDARDQKRPLAEAVQVHLREPNC
jgi:hypothetical protein